MIFLTACLYIEIEDKTIIRFCIILFSTYLLMSNTVLAGTINFIENPFVVHQIHGETLHLSKIDAVQSDDGTETFLLYKTTDGEEGVLNLFNIKNIKEFKTMIFKATSTSEKSASISFNRYESEITKFYDKFTNFSVFSIKLARKKATPGLYLKNDTLNFGLRAMISGKNINERTNPSYSFEFDYTGDRWEFLRFHNLDLIIDGQIFNFGDIEHSGTIGRGYVLEQMEKKVDKYILQRIVESESSEIRIGIIEIDITVEMKNKILAMLIYTGDHK